MPRYEVTIPASWRNVHIKYDGAGDAVSVVATEPTPKAFKAAIRRQNRLAAAQFALLKHLQNRPGELSRKVAYAVLKAAQISVSGAELSTVLVDLKRLEMRTENWQISHRGRRWLRAMQPVI